LSEGIGVALRSRLSSNVSATRQTESVPSILCVGLVCPLKNQNAFIQALDPLAKRHKFELVFLAKQADNLTLAPW